MILGTSMEEILDEFNKIILDLANIDINVDEEDQAILLLSFLDASYANLKEIMMYGIESLTLDEIQPVLHFRALHNKLELKTKSDEGLIVRGRSEKYSPKKKFSKGRSKSREK